MNLLNKIYAAILAILLIILVFNIINSKPFLDKYIYTTSISAPYYFPVAGHAYFRLEDNSINSPQNKSMDYLNGHYSRWLENEFDYLDKQEFNPLPKYLIIDYLDYRTKNYYQDSLTLNTEKIRTTFKNSISKRINLGTSNRPIMGLKFLIGIADNGNVVILLVGKDFVEKVDQFSLKPKSYSDNKFFRTHFSSEQAVFENSFYKLKDSFRLKIDSGYLKDSNYVDSLNIDPAYYNK